MCGSSQRGLHTCWQMRGVAALISNCSLLSADTGVRSSTFILGPVILTWERSPDIPGSRCELSDIRHHVFTIGPSVCTGRVPAHCWEHGGRRMSELSCVDTPYPQLSSDLNAKEIKLLFDNLMNVKSKLLYPHCTSAVCGWVVECGGRFNKLE